MKKFVSHKVVEAGMILAVDKVVGGREEHELLIGENLADGDSNKTVCVSNEWYAKNSDNDAKSLIGGYLVRYEDGYESWSPSEAFEGGYTEVTTAYRADYTTMEGEASGVPLTFSSALFEMKEGNKLARMGWNGKGMYIELQTPTKDSKMTLPYIFMKTAQGDLVPWLASQTDLLAEDWVIVE